MKYFETGVHMIVFVCSHCRRPGPSVVSTSALTTWASATNIRSRCWRHLLTVSRISPAQLLVSHLTYVQLGWKCYFVQNCQIFIVLFSSILWYIICVNKFWAHLLNTVHLGHVKFRAASLTVMWSVMFGQEWCLEWCTVCTPVPWLTWHRCQSINITTSSLVCSYG